eukprot:5160966-Prymnesium_polylepis.1
MQMAIAQKRISPIVDRDPPRSKIPLGLKYPRDHARQRTTKHDNCRRQALSHTIRRPASFAKD